MTEVILNKPRNTSRSDDSATPRQKKESGICKIVFIRLNDCAGKTKSPRQTLGSLFSSPDKNKEKKPQQFTKEFEKTIQKINSQDFQFEEFRVRKPLSQQEFSALVEAISSNKTIKDLELTGTRCGGMYLVTHFVIFDIRIRARSKRSIRMSSTQFDNNTFGITSKLLRRSRSPTYIRYLYINID